MIPIPSTIFSGNPKQLIWTKCRGRSYELSLDDQLLGMMERPSFWSSNYNVEIIDEASGQIIANMKSQWGTGGGTLTFADGQKFVLTVKGWWRPEWTVAPESGQPILRVHARERTMELLAGADAARSRSSLLAMFTYSRVLKAEEDAAAAALAASV